MRRWMIKSLFVTVGVACAFTAPNALAQNPDDWKPSNLEVMQLPRFCWAQFKVPGAEGEEFRIRDCGPLANHYCFGLTYLLRAKKFTGKGKPIGQLQGAYHDIRGTEIVIKDYPQCSIREHVTASRAEVEHLLRMYGAKPPEMR